MLNKAINSGKEKRRHYRGSKSFDRSCRNHGSCPYCERGRTFKRLAGWKNADRAIREFETSTEG